MRRSLRVVSSVVLLLCTSSAPAQSWRGKAVEHFKDYPDYVLDTQKLTILFHEYATKTRDPGIQEKARGLLEIGQSVNFKCRELLEMQLEFLAGSENVSLHDLGTRWRALKQACVEVRREIHPGVIDWSSTKPAKPAKPAKAAKIVSVVTEAPIPEAVLAGIGERAAEHHPGNRSTQQYVIEKQKKAYQEWRHYERPGTVPAHVFEYVREKAGRDHPRDYSTQLFVLRRQMRAYVDIERFELPDGVAGSHLFDIKKYAARRHPYDYSTQLFVINDKLDEYLRYRAKGSNGDAIIRHILRY